MPKTGGTSVRSALASAGLQRNGLARSRTAHSRARDYIHILGRDSWDSAWTFAFTRNPYDRLVSAWAYAFGTGAPDIATFRHWVADGCELHSRYRLDLGQGLKLWIHAPQIEWLIDDDNRLCVRELFRLDRIAHDWRRLAATLDLGSVRHENRSERFATSEYYDAETRKIVRERYRDDFELLGYSEE